LEGRENKNHI